MSSPVLILTGIRHHGPTKSVLTFATFHEAASLARERVVSPQARPVPACDGSARFWVIATEPFTDFTESRVILTGEGWLTRCATGCLYRWSGSRSCPGHPMTLDTSRMFSVAVLGHRMMSGHIASPLRDIPVYQTRCVCGWRSPYRDHLRDAQRMFTVHKVKSNVIPEPLSRRV